MNILNLFKKKNAAPKPKEGDTRIRQRVYGDGRVEYTAQHYEDDTWEWMNIAQPRDNLPAAQADLVLEQEERNRMLVVNEKFI